MRSVTMPLMAAMLLCAGIGIAGAQAQSNGTETVPQHPQAVPEQTMPQTGGDSGDTSQQQPKSGSSAAPGTLSHDLSRSGGVIQPPPTGDSGVVEPPNQGTSRTPVIPPPGTPGGNPKVKPK